MNPTTRPMTADEAAAARCLCQPTYPVTFNKRVAAFWRNRKAQEQQAQIARMKAQALTPCLKMQSLVVSLSQNKEVE